MSFLYFLVTGCDAYKADKILKAYHDYFVTEGGFLTAFLIALAIAGVAAIIYYGWCRSSYSFAKLGTWIITLVVAGCVSYCVTYFATGVSSKNNYNANGSGLPAMVFKKYDKQMALGNYDEQVLEQERKVVVSDLKDGMFRSPVVARLCWTNFFLTIIMFYIISVIVNGFSVHGAHIPHPGIFRP